VDTLRLVWLSILAVVVGKTLLMWLVPYLERQCKTNAAQRQHQRNQHLRGTLADPSSVQDFERRLLIQYYQGQIWKTSHVQQDVFWIE
jgi:hypothetical protein